MPNHTVIFKITATFHKPSQFKGQPYYIHQETDYTTSLEELDQRYNELMIAEYIKSIQIDLT